MFCFVIKLAGIPIEVRCRYEENLEFLKDYIIDANTDREPLFTVEPAEEDLQRIQDGFSRMDKAAGLITYRRTEPYLENNAIHALLAEKLAEHYILLMHGSAMCMDGQAVIFTAPSGTGNSTHAHLWRDLFDDGSGRIWMINDDKPLLRVRDEEVRVFGTPWDGKHHLSRNASAPLKAIVRLERGEENRLMTMGAAAAFQLLFRQVFASPNRETMRKIADLEKKLLINADHIGIGFYRLVCNMEPEAALVAWEGISAAVPSAMAAVAAVAAVILAECYCHCQVIMHLRYIRHLNDCTGDDFFGA